MAESVPRNFLMYESKNECSPKSKRFLLHRLDSFGPGIRCLLYWLYTRSSVEQKKKTLTQIIQAIKLFEKTPNS